MNQEGCNHLDVARLVIHLVIALRGVTITSVYLQFVVFILIFVLQVGNG